MQDLRTFATLDEGVAYLSYRTRGTDRHDENPNPGKREEHST
jgi:hypothetical protein